MMHITYDPEADAFYARFTSDSVAIAETREVAPGVTIDLDAGGQIVGIEVLSVAVRGSGTYGPTPPRNAAE
jgi:uncharacterized protein YuzE